MSPPDGRSGPAEAGPPVTSTSTTGPDQGAAVTPMVTHGVEVEQPLSPTETELLDKCEAVVDAGLATFVEVGNALATIRDRRLYRQTHTDFGVYVRDRWDVSKAHAHRLIAAAAVKVSPIGDKITNEAQARALAPLLDDPDEMRAVVERAERNGKITAESLAAARDEPPVPTRAQLQAELDAAIAAAAETSPTTITIPATVEDAVHRFREIDQRMRRGRRAFARLFLFDAQHPTFAAEATTRTAEPDEVGMWLSIASAAFDAGDDDPDVLRMLGFLASCGFPIEDEWHGHCDATERVMRQEPAPDRWRARASLAAYQAKLFAAIAEAES